MAQTINIVLNAAAAGTVDVITATYSPALTAYTDKRILAFRATGANTSATPTFNANALGAKTIVKKGGSALVAGDIPAANAIALIQYDLANDRFELMNPGSDANTPTNPTDTRLPYNNAGTFADSWLIHGANEVKILNGKFYEDETGSIQQDFGGGAIYYAITTDGGTYVTPYIYMDGNDGYFAKSDRGFFFGNFTAAGVNKIVHIRETELELKHNLKIELDSPDINLPQETASLILSTDASKNIKGLPLATYPSLTELSRVKGVTAAIEPRLTGQISKIGHASQNYADLTTYSFGLNSNIIPVTSEQLRSSFSSFINGNVESVKVCLNYNASSPELATLKIRNATQGTEVTVTTIDFSASVINAGFYISGLTLAVNAGDVLYGQIVTPTWVTNPNSVTVGMEVYIKAN